MKISSKCPTCEDGYIMYMETDDSTGETIYYNNGGQVFCNDCLDKLKKLIKTVEVDEVVEN